MTQDEHHRNACAKFAVHRLDVFDLDPLEDLLRRHCREFYAAKQVGAEPPKMPTYKATQFPRRLFIAKSNLNVAFCETPIFPRNEPRTRAEEFTNREQKPQWQGCGNGRPRAIKKVNDKVEHCRSGVSQCGGAGEVCLRGASNNMMLAVVSASFHSFD